jgi:hypothetical protein
MRPRDYVLSPWFPSAPAQAAALRRALGCHALQGVLHQAEQLIAIQGELDLAAAGHDGDTGLGWLGLVGVVSLRIGSFQGGSSFLVKGRATSNLATGREEPPSSLFN